MIKLKSIAYTGAVFASLASFPQADAQSGGNPAFSDGVVKLGVLTDMSGPYADYAGNGSFTAVKMAVEDFGGKLGGNPVEVIVADHQNKSDVGVSIARAWYDVDKVDAIFDISNSAVALAVAGVTKEKNKVVILGGVSTPKITTDTCTPNSVQYIYDANALSNVVGKAIVRDGGDSWFFLTVDFAFGHGLEKTTADVVKASGGKVLGSVRFPLNTADFSSFLLQAQASNAKIIALASAGSDTTNAIKGATEFGISNTGRQRVATLLTFITDVHSMGLAQAQNLLLATAFYWDGDGETRKFAKRFHERMGKMPTMVQAGMYSAAMHYLRSAEKSGTDAGAEVVAQMKAGPIDDFFSKGGRIRPDGLHEHEMQLMRVKTPSESKAPWDYYALLSTVPAAEAFSPMVPGACAAIK
ncbi:ABC transporter substrate-binding protein [Xanthobacter sp. KR7-65]|uniref:ABC transporter substrate-binding protein n=1 Tax=Xanthobacter sp. KR7-65 TaxID=3156612 RepID=UPI0032B5AB48